MDKLSVDAVFVLSVKTFEDRINHVKKQMALHQIEYQFVFDFDIPDLNTSLLIDTFETENVLDKPLQSLVLKHIQTWRLCVEHQFQNILVFEDDVILSDNFVPKLNQAIKAIEQKQNAYLLFLGGADTKVSDAFLLSNESIVEQPIATTEAYVTNYSACTKRLAWLSSNKVNLPSDFLLRKIDPELGISQYWLKEHIAEQGSVTGIFESRLDKQRRKHSLLFNYLRYEWQKINRKKLRKFYALVKSIFK
jgi:glycosyl transferase family 25